MKNKAGEKVKKIIEEEFDLRVGMTVITYILDRGFENLKEVTEEDILKVEGNGFMTERFCQSLVRASVRICKECHQIDEFLPFIVNHLYVPNAKMKEITIFKEECQPWDWEDFLRTYDLEDLNDEEEINSITLNANVVNTVHYKGCNKYDHELEINIIG